MQTKTKKVKRNYEIENKYSAWKMLRCIKRYKPTKLKYAIFINKMNNTI